jgi:hypothetical protein
VAASLTSCFYQIGSNGSYSERDDFQRILLEAIKVKVGPNPRIHIRQFSIIGEIDSSAAAALATTITTAAPYLHGKVQGIENPSFTAAMEAVYLIHIFLEEQRRQRQREELFSRPVLGPF